MVHHSELYLLIEQTPSPVIATDNQLVGPNVAGKT